MLKILSILGPKLALMGSKFTSLPVILLSIIALFGVTNTLSYYKGHKNAVLKYQAEKVEILNDAINERIVLEEKINLLSRSLETAKQAEKIFMKNLKAEAIKYVKKSGDAECFDDVGVQLINSSANAIMPTDPSKH